MNSNNQSLLAKLGDWASITGAVLTVLQFLGISTGILPGLGLTLKGEPSAWFLAITATVVVWGFLFLVQAKVFAHVQEGMAEDSRYFLVWFIVGVLGLALCCGSVLLIGGSLLPSLGWNGLTLWLISVGGFWAAATFWWMLASAR